MKNLFNFDKVALIFGKFVHPSQVKTLLWIIFLITFSPFLFFLNIQFVGELPSFFDNSFFFHLFIISWFLYLPILFLDEKTFTIFGDSLFSIDGLKAGVDIFIFLASILYAHLLSCLLELFLTVTIRLTKKHVKL